MHEVARRLVRAAFAASCGVLAACAAPGAPAPRPSLPDSPAPPPAPAAATVPVAAPTASTLGPPTPALPVFAHLPISGRCEEREGVEIAIVRGEIRVSGHPVPRAPDDETGLEKAIGRCDDAAGPGRYLLRTDDATTARQLVAVVGVMVFLNFRNVDWVTPTGRHSFAAGMPALGTAGRWVSIATKPRPSGVGFDLTEWSHAPASALSTRERRTSVEGEGALGGRLRAACGGQARCIGGVVEVSGDTPLASVEPLVRALAAASAGRRPFVRVSTEGDAELFRAPSGRLPPSLIQAVVRRNFGVFSFCYESALKRVPGLQGRVAVRFVIPRDGVVTEAVDEGSDLPDAEARRCVIQSFVGLSFPPPDNGVVPVVYPVSFAPH